MGDYQPPFTATAEIITLVADIAEAIGRLSVAEPSEAALRLRRINRIRTIQGSLAIEGNTLIEEQITAILAGKHVLAPPRDVQEARNALAVYERLDDWAPSSEKDLLAAHRLLMKGLLDVPGQYRSGGVGVMAGDRVVHTAPPANRVPLLMQQLLEWLSKNDLHPLIVSSVFHYEFEFIHPFADGNGRIGRLWQTLILTCWNPVFAHIPVESLVHAHQQGYYDALNASTRQSDAAPFVAFMLARIREAIAAANPQVAPQVTPQVMQLVKALRGEMSRDDLQSVLGLNDRKSFVARYLKPALDAGLIEYTRPEVPSSRLQRYRLTVSGKSVGKRG